VGALDGAAVTETGRTKLVGITRNITSRKMRVKRNQVETRCGRVGAVSWLASLSSSAMTQ